MAEIREAVIVAGCRTPIGKFLGGLSTVAGPELGAAAIAECLKRANIQPTVVDEVIMGNVLPAGVGQAPARQAALKAGLPDSVAALTINKVCGSGLKAVSLAAQAVQLGEADVVVAGGMESMSLAPHLLPTSRTGVKFGNQPMIDHMLLDGLTCAFEGCPMGEHAEYIAQSRSVTREDQDAFSALSQQRAAQAIESGAFDDEIVPFTVKGRKGDTVISKDEGPRPETTAEGLSKLRPSFGKEGTVTAGNASMLSDGAAAVVVTTPQKAESLGVTPLARIVASATGGLAPKELFVAPVVAVQKLLKKTGLSLADIDLFEINEAFASQMVACLRGLELSSDNVNVHGGAIALGHPIGASGARVLVTLLSAMKQRDVKRGLATLCLGGGNAVAMLVERP